MCTQKTADLNLNYGKQESHALLTVSIGLEAKELLIKWNIPHKGEGISEITVHWNELGQCTLSRALRKGAIRDNTIRLKFDNTHPIQIKLIIY